MPRQRGQRLNFQFNKGWNTEASPLTFPEGTAQDLENVILDIDGSIRRRPGVNFDKQAAVIAGATANSTKAIGFFQWENVAGSGSLAFVVTQVGTSLYFHTQAGPDTIDNYVGTVNFSSFATDSVEAQKSVVSVTSGLGYLFVVGEFIEPFYVEYDFNNGSLTATEILVKIRDFEGVDDGLDVDERPSVLSNLHKYNLRNQGWPVSFPCDSGSDPLARTKTVLGVYPSNADILGYGKVENATEPGDIGKYSPSTLRKNNFGTTPAPKGKYTFNAFDINRGTIVGGATRKYTLRRPRAVAFHNGRVFYSGVNATGYTSNVYYSQQLTDVDRVGKCYQENDPTAEEFNELLATDGGLLTIPNAGGILALAEGPAGIVVFASNGIWEITGQEGKFSATEFYVRKVTDMGCIGAETVINADGTLIYWSNAGIIALQPDQITSNLAPNNLTQNTIQTGYLLIGGVQQRWARGIYVPEEKKAVWIYSTSSSYNGTTNRFKYNGMLIMDMQLGAFYKYKISDTAGTTPYIAGITKTTAFTTTVNTDIVTAGGDIVTAGGENVTAGTSSAVGSEVEISSWKLLTVKGGSSLTFSEFNYTGFYDWYYYDGVGADYSSFIETGYDTGGMPMFDKKPTYIWVYLSRYSKSRLSGGYYNLGIGSTQEYTDYCDDLSLFTATGAVSNFSSTLTDIHDLAISDDGTTMYMFDRDYNLGAGRVKAYPLSTPGDFSTISTTPSATFNLTSVDVAHGISFGDSGSKMYIYGGNNASLSPTRVDQFNLSTPWDISTASFSNEITLTTGLSGAWNPDGTEFFWLSSPEIAVRKYTAGTPWVASTLTYSGDLFVHSGEFTAAAHDIDFNPIGTKMYLIDDAADDIYEYVLSTAWDITTATYTGNVIDTSLLGYTQLHGICMWWVEGGSGTKIYAANSTTRIVSEYELNCS